MAVHHPITRAELDLLEQGAPLWLFAYGSLIWRPGFRYEERVRGYIEGYARRFWQASTDHRGVPEKPGRVVTLIAQTGAECWGVCYRVAPSDRERVMEELDVREKGGYVLRRMKFVAKDRGFSGELEPLVYVAEQGNPNYVGETPLAQIASIVAQASGPSGHNVEYVLRLAEALSDLGVIDEHVFELSNYLSDPDVLLNE